VYRHGEDASSVTLDPVALEAAFRNTMDPNTLIELDLDGTTRLCLIQDVQRHPVSQVLRHVDLYEVNADQVVDVKVRVKTEGIAEGVKIGGSMQYINRTLDVQAKVTDIPSTIVVDVSEMEIGSFVRASDIAAPKGSTIVFESDFNVLACMGKRGGGLDEEDEGVEEVAEGDAPAETEEG
jgi:large subunit ribosomal protein L25